MDETNFLKMLVANPQDDSTRLVYADWLEETGSEGAIAKAEFLRLTVKHALSTNSQGARKQIQKQLQGLAADLDTEWLVVVSILRIENCYGKRREAESARAYRIRFDYQCDRKWQDLKPTDDSTQRYCDGCDQKVHYCGTIMEAREHAVARHCIAVDLGIIRREGDISVFAYAVAGMPSPESLHREMELAKPDAVSANREEQKKQKAAGAKQ